MFMLTHGNGKHPIQLQESKPSPLAQSVLNIIAGGTNKGCDLKIRKPQTHFSFPFVYSHRFIEHDYSCLFTSNKVII